MLRNVINLALTCRSCSGGRLSCYWTPLNSISTSHELLYGASWSETSSTVVRLTDGAQSGSNSWVWRVKMTQPSWKHQVKLAFLRMKITVSQIDHSKHVKRKYCHMWMRISSCEIYVFTPELRTFMFVTRRFKFPHVKSTFAFDCFTCEACHMWNLLLQMQRWHIKSASSSDFNIFTSESKTTKKKKTAAPPQRSSHVNPPESTCATESYPAENRVQFHMFTHEQSENRVNPERLTCVTWKLRFYTLI